MITCAHTSFRSWPSSPIKTGEFDSFCWIQFDGSKTEYILCDVFSIPLTGLQRAPLLQHSFTWVWSDCQQKCRRRCWGCSFDCARTRLRWFADLPPSTWRHGPACSLTPLPSRKSSSRPLKTSLTTIRCEMNRYFILPSEHRLSYFLFSFFSPGLYSYTNCPNKHRHCTFCECRSPGKSASHLFIYLLCGIYWW